MPEGVQFPLVDGRRSTQRTGTDVIASAAAAVDPGLAAQIRAEQRWRTSYPRHLRQLTELAAGSGAAGLDIARAGLARVHTVFTHDGGDGPRAVGDAVRAPLAAPGTRTVRGDGTAPPRLAVPYRGRERAGDELLATVDDWIARGVVEPAVGTAIGELVADPDQLDLRGRWFGVLGAGAEMAPTELLLRWGADVAAVDLPVPAIWQRLAQLARSGSGTLHAPVLHADDPPGADLVVDAARIRAWLAALDRPLVLGNYAYADGETFARLSVAADAVLDALCDADAGHGIACLATPTDVFAVPIDVVEATRARQAGFGLRTLAPLLRGASAGRLLVPNHRRTVPTERGPVGIADSLVVQQGPNYALAKRIQRWRAVAADAAGRFAAIHVAPPTRTVSVTRNRVLAAAYGGASLFDVEVFAPETSRALMAALLVHALRTPQPRHPGAGPRPEHELTAPAAHGGLWRVRWETRSAFPFAIARGARALLPLR